ncbi:hypothetical protein BB559_004265 [Furculomyces boomerangus]|uniref:N-acyl-aliphatic-L-amino acid amidohydrolase n=2 Tax=Harpellales TaxID=61421 RepID=A0A2T9YFM4_9FUNG|nr:hypothetical protein BB559_004265 [Furculomyces boomerangus]PWA01480.1 hypothetical protein BB558_002425 [Smittium angustum]
MTADEPQSVARFREFLRIKTVPPVHDYAGCNAFLIRQAEEIGLEHQIVECVKGIPVVILKLAGTDPTAKSILLSSHIDVVPVFEERWTYPPFGATRVPTEDGDHKIYSRGTQDMKITCMHYLEALRILAASGKKFKRNVFAVFAPDEETGGYQGIGEFVKSKEFEELNAGFDVDEGMPAAGQTHSFFYAERSTIQFTITAVGSTGHGSQFLNDTAIEKIIPAVNELLAFRTSQKEKFAALNDNENIKSGEVTSINLTQFNGGKQINIIPATYSASFDVRVSPKDDFQKIRNMIIDIAKKNGLEIKFYSQNTEASAPTVIDKENIFISTFFNVCEKRNMNIVPIICPATSDARHVRSKGIPSFGVNPILNHPFLAHDHDEYIIESEYIKGIDFYVDLIPALANC